jgi:flagellar basal-body rod protein FlgB
MIDLGGVTGALVRLGLDVAVLRHQVIANNIANVHTPGFLPGRVHFESLLSEAVMQPPGAINDAALRRELEALAPLVREGSTLQASADAEVELDLEMVRLTENMIRYRALIEALGKRTAVIAMAINERRQS